MHLQLAVRGVCGRLGDLQPPAASGDPLLGGKEKRLGWSMAAPWQLLHVPEQRGWSALHTVPTQGLAPELLAEAPGSSCQPACCSVLTRAGAGLQAGTW